MKISMKLKAGEESSKSIEQHMPPFVVQDLKEDGSGPFGDKPQDTLLKMIFPLPSQSLMVGESVDVPAQMPFSAMGSVLQVTGYSNITLTRYVRIGDRRCAQLYVVTDISNLKVPSEVKGDFKSSIKGTSVLYFDVASRSLVSGVITMIEQFSIDAPMPQLNIPLEDPSSIPKRSKISMVSDNFIKLELRE